MITRVWARIWCLTFTGKGYCLLVWILIYICTIYNGYSEVRCIKVVFCFMFHICWLPIAKVNLTNRHLANTIVKMMTIYAHVTLFTFHVITIILLLRQYTIWASVSLSNVYKFIHGNKAPIKWRRKHAIGHSRHEYHPNITSTMRIFQ